jgi:predicted metal-dependent peptidase
MQDIDKLALDRVAKARAELILDRTFYGVLVSQVEPKLSRQFPTMATNGKVHFVNPDFIAELTQDEVLGVQAHESEHDARRHHTRRGHRDPKKWNEATDYAINIDLIDEGFTLPKGALVDPKYRGMSAEDIYRSREIDEALEQQKQQEQSQADDESDESESDQQPEQDQDDGQSEDESDDGDQDSDTDEGEGGGDADDADEGDQDGQGGGEAGQGDDEANGKGGGGDADDEAEGEGQGQGEGEGAEAEGQGEGQGEGGDAESAGESAPQSSGDPGRCGEVLDAAEDAADVAAEDSKWETVLRQAAALAAKRGTAPGHVAREIERADHPPQDWRETLRAWFDNGATSQETWTRPNRRFIGGGLYLPGRQRDGINKAVFMIDTSGSVTYYPGALEAIKVETQAALDENIIDEVVVLYGDTRVTRVDTYRNGDEVEFDPRGGGGTDLRPMFEHVATEIDDAKLIVAFTDLEIGDPGPEPHCPVLWAAVGYPESVKRYLANTPWNAPGIEVRPVE